MNEKNEIEESMFKRQDHILELHRILLLSCVKSLPIPTSHMSY